MKIINNFLSSFKSQFLKYTVDPLLKPMINESIRIIKSLGIQVEEYNFNSTELETMIKLIKSIENQSGCLIACIPYEYDKHLQDSTRFQSDAPFRSFKQLKTSPLAPAFLKGRFDFVLDSNLKDICESNCVLFDKIQNEFIKFLNPLYENQVDALVFPSFASTAHPQTEISIDDSFLILSVLSNNAFLSMPSGFTSSSPSQPDGLPFGMGLSIKAERLENGLKIAKLYESKKSFVKLPSSFPLLKRTKNCTTINN